MIILITSQKNILVAQVPHHDEEAGSIVFHSSRNASEFKNDNNEGARDGICSSKSERIFVDQRC